MKEFRDGGSNIFSSQTKKGREGKWIFQLTVTQHTNTHTDQSEDDGESKRGQSLQNPSLPGLKRLREERRRRKAEDID